ncbi:hypothetical protein [Galbibacter sp. PAP.153]|uniref:hypothetical protein n=1 Tax=Galbibacter sp. PAP.153 TaxID=3104623 RepID=UPI003009C110
MNQAQVAISLSKLSKSYKSDVTNHLVEIVTSGSIIVKRKKERQEDFYFDTKAKYDGTIEELISEFENEIKQSEIMISKYLIMMSVVFLQAKAEDILNKMIYEVIMYDYKKFEPKNVKIHEINIHELNNLKEIKGQILKNDLHNHWGGVYGRIKYIKTNTNILIKSEDYIILKEMSVYRNLIVHHDSKMTKKAKKEYPQSKFKIGDEIVVSYQEVFYYILAIERLLKEFKLKFVLKYGTTPKSSI